MELGSRKTSVSLVSVVATLLALVVGAAAFMYSGVYNVAATAEHNALTSWILNTTQKRSVRARVEEVPDPPPVDSAALSQGFEHFRTMCVTCHGAPGVERSELGRGITPTPPDLGQAATEFTTRELFWITKHGIKMAGMPAFGRTHSEEELWGIVAFVEELAGMSERAYGEWEAGAR